MISKQYILWSVMIGVLIMAAASVLVGLVALSLYALGVITIGWKIVEFIVSWLIIFLIPFYWFTEAAE